jgi:predicted permease
MTSWLRLIWSRLRSMLTTNRLDREFDEELTTHLTLLTDDFQRRGLSAQDARREALLKLGRPDRLREVHREQRGLPLFDILAQDLRYALRMLLKSPAFTFVVTLSLALGIGANTALFSLVDSVLLRSLPVREPDRLVQIQLVPNVPGGFRKPIPFFERSVFDAVRAQNQIVSEVVGMWRLDRPTIAIDGGVEPAREVDQISTNFFRDLGVAPIVGRAPEPSDDAVAVISDRWWRARFDGNAGVLGRALSIDGKTYSIIGVAPPRFHGFIVENSADVWISSPSSNRELMMIARLKPDVTATQAQPALHGLLTSVLQQRLNDFAPKIPIETELVPAGQGLSQLRGQYRGALLALMVLVTLVLLTTCTNVGNLLMVRNAVRNRELTVRAALGAARSRLILQYLVESTLLAAVGCALGLLLARWGVSMILSMLPLPAIPASLTFHADARVLGFAAGVSLLSALLFGLAPAWRATEVDATACLRSSQGTTAPRSVRRLGRVLVACQVGLSVLLLVGAGLFVRTLQNLSRQNIGFNPDRLLQVSIDTRFAGYGKGQVGAVYRLLLERVAAVPGVHSVTGARNPVLRHSLSRMSMRLPGVDFGQGEFWDGADVGPSFFETMGIPVIRGRTFTAADFAGDQRGLFVVSESWVKRYFPNDDPVARQIGIIGVVKDVKLDGVRTEVRPTMFAMAMKEPDRVNSLQVRTASEPEAIVPAIRKAIQGINPKLLVGIRTMREDVDRDIAKERMVSAISAFFSVLGLVLASIGIFGVASYTVAQRTKELAIRRALGADRWSVIRESLRETMLVFGLGLVAGTLAAVAAVRFSASVVADLLFGLTATDAANIALAVAVMVTAALAACVLPAHRATTIDPLAGLRQE